ncbi:Cyclin-dependent kinase 11B [Trichoplax sp. H2]|nr:Cyclin-dependent kinase 11B [Trichoplax sp. H2]|eukprot:RDD41238.1 Cyclin-dependent kinase 11B [Trichoplax sp. H2]
MATKKAQEMHNQNLDSIKVKTLEEILQEKRNRSRSDSENIAETEDSPDVTSDTKDETTSAALELDEGEIISSGEENLNHIDDTKPTKRNHTSQNDELDDYEEGEIKDRDEVERKEEFMPAADSSIISNRQISTTSSRKRDDRVCGIITTALTGHRSSEKDIHASRYHYERERDRDRERERESERNRDSRYSSDRDRFSARSQRRVGERSHKYHADDSRSDRYKSSERSSRSHYSDRYHRESSSDSKSPKYFDSKGRESRKELTDNLYNTTDKSPIPNKVEREETLIRHDKLKTDIRASSNLLPAAETMEVVDVELSSEESDQDNLINEERSIIEDEDEENEHNDESIKSTDLDGSIADEQGPESGSDGEKEAELPPYLPAVQGCRSVEAFEWLNRIEEGTYGVVYRAKDLKSDEVVALKRLKMEKEREGFPITSLREINTLLKADHPNIVHVREIVVGSNMDKIYIVMEYVEHDLKTLMESMSQPFSISEVKCLMKQLLSAVQHLHDNWILHRDLKTSNLLLSHQGILKVGDFGLAREYGSPLKVYTSIVVTLWYRCPELLLGVKEYSTAVDMWSVGCIFGEFLVKKPLFPGKSEIDQLNKIFKDLGTPNDQIWSGFSELPVAKKVTFTEQPYNRLRDRFGAYLTDQGFDLLNRFLTYDPKKRISAEDALNHEYFQQEPRPLDPSMFPTWPAKSELMKRPSKANRSPTAPEGGGMCKDDEIESQIAGAADGFRITYATQGKAAGGAGFNLKF